jgi:preprotein translocase subunit YajC
MFATPAFAQAAGAAPTSFLSPGNPLWMMVIIIGIMYFLMIRPQQKKVKAHQAMVAALRRGDQVITQGGIIGKVSKVTEGQTEIEIEIAPNVKVRVIRSTISSVINRTEPTT